MRYTRHSGCKQKHSPNKKRYLLDIKRVRLVKKCWTKSSFGFNHQGLFQVPASMPYYNFRVANSFKARLVNVLAGWIFARKTPGANSAFMDIDELWKANIPTYSDDAMVCNHRCEHVVESFLMLAIVAKDMQVLIRDRTTADSEQLRISQISARAALQGSLNELVTFYKLLGFNSFCHCNFIICTIS